MRFKAQKPGRLGRAKTGRSHIPAQKFSLLADLIHLTGTLSKDATMPSVSHTPRRAENRHLCRTVLLLRFVFRSRSLMRPQPCVLRAIVVCLPCCENDVL
jgi:hypothetical protein